MSEGTEKLNPWHPMADSVDLKHLGKFAEELGECSAAVARCLIQGIEEAEPVTGKPNREWLEDEIADVQANIGLVVLRFDLDQDRIARRVAKKMRQLSSWHKMA
jgi:NTP pyrophosphatase (non-canonical NTP hydrolase)